MAAVLGVLRSFGMKARILSHQPAKLSPIIQLRLMADKKAGSGKTSSDKPDSIKEDPTSYNVPEYYSYNKDSFADLEVQMNQANYRQSQPDPRVPYHHHYPWEKST